MAQHLEPSASSKNNEDALFALFLVEYDNLDLATHPWYRDIIYYFQFQRCPNNLEYHEHRRTQLEASQYIILRTSLFRRTIDGLIYVDYRELNKATQKDHFPLPFINQVFDTLEGKTFFPS
jgi:hypothetical protein